MDLLMGSCCLASLVKSLYFTDIDLSDVLDESLSDAMRLRQGHQA